MSENNAAAKLTEDSDELIELAKLAEQAERYDDMKAIMKKVVESGAKLKDEGRNLLSVAYKNVVGARRTAWRVISSLSAKNEGKNDNGYRELVEKELLDYCDEILNLLKTYDIESEPCEAQVFFHKMRGDYYRYQVEVLKRNEPQWEETAKKSEDSYDDAIKVAKELPEASPIRLGLALNFSVFFYEIRSNSTRACELAQEAFSEAVAKLDEHPQEESYKDSALILQLLRDNLTLWRADQDEGDD